MCFFRYFIHRHLLKNDNSDEIANVKIEKEGKKRRRKRRKYLLFFITYLLSKHELLIRRIMDIKKKEIKK
jgi:hypothetical protein